MGGALGPQPLQDLDLVLQAQDGAPLVTFMSHIGGRATGPPSVPLKGVSSDTPLLRLFRSGRQNRCPSVTDFGPAPALGTQGYSPCLLRGAADAGDSSQQSFWSRERGVDGACLGTWVTSELPFPGRVFPLSPACSCPATLASRSRESATVLGARRGAAMCLPTGSAATAVTGPICAEGCTRPAWVRTLGLWEELGPGGGRWQAGPGGSFCDLLSLGLQGGGLNEAPSQLTLRSVIYSAMIIGC